MNSDLERGNRFPRLSICKPESGARSSAVLLLAPFVFVSGIGFACVLDRQAYSHAPLIPPNRPTRRPSGDKNPNSAVLAISWHHRFHRSTPKRRRKSVEESKNICISFWPPRSGSINKDLDFSSGQKSLSTLRWRPLVSAVQGHRNSSS